MPATRRTPSKFTISLAGSTVAMAGLAAGLAIGLPGTAAAQPTRLASHAVAQAAATQVVAGSAAVAVSAGSFAAATLADEELVASVKAGLGRTRQQQILRAISEAAARQQARRRAAALAAAQRAQAAQAAKAAARQAAVSQTAAASGSPQQIAQGMLASYGWAVDQFTCLDSLWSRESGWNVSAANPSSGAYGIPQALPGSKMASAGPDWQTNAATQIRWGLTYIQGSYGSPCGAWAHEEADGWY